MNGQTSSWSPILDGVTQGLFKDDSSFYINDLSHNFSSNAKLFADDASIFSIVYDIDSSTKEWWPIKDFSLGLLMKKIF